MPGFGFGFGSHRSNARFVGVGSGSIVPVIMPSAIWSGQPGSGFTSAPSDPLRTTAKPVLRLIIPPNQFFSDELLVGVMAGANDGGNLLTNLGLEQVIVHFEGARRTIGAPSLQTFADANGTYRSYLGWWALLRHDGRHGHGQVYFEAVPRDRELQRRVIGPFQFSAQPRIHDGAMTVASGGGGDMRTIGEALAECRVQRFDNPLITIIEAGDYDIVDPGLPYEGAGYCTITGSVPKVRIAKPAYSGDEAAVLRSRYGGLRFRGANLTIDTRFISHIHSEASATRSHWLDGCAVVNSGGNGVTWRGGLRPVPWLVEDGGWFTECAMTDCSDAFAGAKLVRGTSAVGGHGELYSGCPAVIANTSTSHRGDLTLSRDVPALNVRYTGTAANATIELSGNQSAASRVVTVKITGQADRSFPLEKSEAAFQAGTNYTLAHLVAWLEAIPGISASIVDGSQTRAAAWLSLAGRSGSAFSASDIKSATLLLVTHIGGQSVWWRDTGGIENAVLWGNVAIDMVGRVLEVDGPGATSDLLIANNAVQNDASALPSPSLTSRLDGTNGHLVLAHNTLSTQSLTLSTEASYSPDGYCMVANNSLRGIGWGGAPAGTLIRNNHLHAGQSAPASAPGKTNVAGTTIGGSETSLYVDDRGGDFTARGELLGNLAPSVLRYSALGEPIAAVDVKGSRNAPALQRPQPVRKGELGVVSSVSQYGMTWNFAEPRPAAMYENGDIAVLAPVTITAITPESVVIDGTLSDGWAYTGRKVHGTWVDPGNRRWAAGGLKENNSGHVGLHPENTFQGWDSLSSNQLHPDKRAGALAAYANYKNEDPGNTGQALAINGPASVVKAISFTEPAETSDVGGTILSDMAVLSVVDALPGPGDLRPAFSMTSKQVPFNVEDLELSAFQNLTPPAKTPSFESVIEKIKRMHQLSISSTVDAQNINAKNNYGQYGREVGKNIGDALLYLHLNIAPEQKRELLMYIAQIAIDAAGRNDEGCVPFRPGGGNAWKRTPVVLTAIALGAGAVGGRGNCPQWLYDEAMNNTGWTEDVQLQIITAADVAATKHLTGKESRPLLPYYHWMIGAMDWEDFASHVIKVYRNIHASYLIQHALAVRLTAGAEALWGNPMFFKHYLETEYHYEVVRTFNIRIGAGTNAPNAFARSFASAYRPVLTEPPRLVDAFVNGDPPGNPLPGKSSLRLIFDRPLDDTSVPTAAAFTVRVDGAVVAANIAPAVPAGYNSLIPASNGGEPIQGIYRNCVGLEIATTVNSNQTIVVDYVQPASGRLQSVDGVAFPATATPITTINETPSIGGQNAAFPRVRFTAVDYFDPSPANNLKFTDNAPRGTVFVKDFRLLTAPPGDRFFFSTVGGGPCFQIAILGNRQVRITLRGPTGAFMGGWPTATGLVLDKAYDLLFSWDLSDPATASGITSLINGTSSRGFTSWNGAPANTVGWNQTVTQSWRFNNGLHFEMGAFYLNMQERITDPTLFSKTTGGLLDIGTLGEGVTGRRPEIFYIGNAGQWNDGAIQRGSLNQFRLFKNPSAPGVVDTVTEQSQWT